MIGDGGHVKKAFTDMLVHCLPAMRRALCRGEEALPQFITSAEYTTFMSMDGKSLALEEDVQFCIHYFSSLIHCAQYYEEDKGQIPAGNVLKYRQAVKVHCRCLVLIDCRVIYRHLSRESSLSASSALKRKNG